MLMLMCMPGAMPIRNNRHHFSRLPMLVPIRTGYPAPSVVVVENQRP